MPDQFMIALWLLAGGLVVVSIALGALGIAYVQLRREMARRDGAGRKPALKRADEAFSPTVTGALGNNGIAAIFRDEWAVFQAGYRDDFARILAEIRSGHVPVATSGLQSGLDRLDQAITLARAGHNADFIMRACEIDAVDAEALVRFHGPDRTAGPSSER